MPVRLLPPVAGVCVVAALVGACGSTASTVGEASSADTQPLVRAAGTSGVDTEPSSSPTDGVSVTVATEAAYDEREVRFVQPVAGFALAGTLTIPAGSGPFPGVVLISGSGTQDRNETIGTSEPFLDLADGLARRGIVVLRFDDRGAGDSGGEPIELSDATTLDNGLVLVVVLAAAALTLGIVLRGDDDTTVTREPAIQWTTPTAGPGSTTLGPD